jgi:Flp pilus assembly pilin Flp
VLRAIYSFLKRDLAQDLAEYCLITALIVIIALGVIWHVSGGIQGMWDTANTTLVNGNSNAATGSAGTANTQGNQGI